MKRNLLKKYSLVVVLLALLSPNYSAADNSNLIDRIRHNCVTNRRQIDKLRSSDALKRVNLGQNYEAILGLMEKLNTRVVINKLNGANLITEAANFNENFGYFKANYQAYERELTNLKNIDCQSHPQYFLQQLTRTRHLRRETDFNTKKLNQLAKTYLEAVEKFEKELK